MFAFACLDLQGASANLLSIGAIDFGILVDAAVIMVENIYRRLAESDERPDELMAIIRDAAAEVDRPLFYSVVVIVVSFLPIYVLTGPVGRAVQADGGHDDLRADRLADRHPDPASGALLLADAQRRSRAAQRDLRAHPLGLHARPRSFSRASARERSASRALLLLASLLLSADVGAEFMPHLDEGALWVRATMPYTISFDESAKIVPQIRSIIASFPEVTTVASEHGRPDDGTDATGFFNAEFYVGLKPYSRVARRRSAPSRS